jgi:hypothetical protein
MTENKPEILDPNKDAFYHPLGKQDYSENHFLKGMKRVKSLRASLEKILEDKENPQAIENASSIIYGDKSQLYKTGEPIRPLLESEIVSGKKGIEEYVSHNESKFLAQLEDKDYLSLVQGVKLNKIEGNEEHNQLVGVFEAYSKIQEASKDKDSIYRYIAEQIKKAPKSMQDQFARAYTNDNYLNLMFNSYFSVLSHNRKEVLEKADCKKLFTESMKASKKKVEYHAAIAEVLYSKLEKKD